MGPVRRIRIWLAVFMAGLVVSGVTAFPLESELKFIVALMADSHSGMAQWLKAVYEALRATNQGYPFLAYGTDWLAFAHLVIALAFIGPWKDPVRNRWVIDFGIMACLGVIPLAAIAGAVRGIPLAWRCIDMSFGVFGMVPLIACRRCIDEMERPKRVVDADAMWMELVASFHL